jgi:hypothetical protein
MVTITDMNGCNAMIGDSVLINNDQLEVLTQINYSSPCDSVCFHYFECLRWYRDLICINGILDPFPISQVLFIREAILFR